MKYSGRNSRESCKENPGAEVLSFCLLLPLGFIFLLLCRVQMFLEGLKVNKISLWPNWQRLRGLGGGPCESGYRSAVLCLWLGGSREVTQFYGALELFLVSYPLPFFSLNNNNQHVSSTYYVKHVLSTLYILICVLKTEGSYHYLWGYWGTDAKHHAQSQHSWLVDRARLATTSVLLATTLPLTGPWAVGAGGSGSWVKSGWRFCGSAPSSWGLGCRLLDSLI